MMLDSLLLLIATAITVVLALPTIEVQAKLESSQNKSHIIRWSNLQYGQYITSSHAE